MAAAALCIEEGHAFIEFLKQVDGKSRPDRYYEQVAEVFAASACTLLHKSAMLLSWFVCTGPRQWLHV